MILIGKRIKELRNKYKYTQTELAYRLGVTKSTVAAYENDSRQPSYEVLVKMSDVFKVSVDSILISRPDSIINIEGLSVEQIELVENLISHLRRCELLEQSINNVKQDKNTKFAKLEH